MAIVYNEKTGIFTLNTKNTTYQMAVDKYGTLLHQYYGIRILGEDLNSLFVKNDRGFSPNPHEAGEDRTYSLDTLLQEFSGYGDGDYRLPSICLVNGDGSYAFCGRVSGHRIYHGKYSVEKMPYLQEQDGDTVDTLEIYLTDKVTGVDVALLYGVFEEKDVITRAVRITNHGTKKIVLEKAMSVMLDFIDSDYDFIHFGGRHAMEHEYHRQPVSYGIQSIGSTRGYSSHQHNPCAILCERGATEESGDCYGFILEYSGNFLCEVEKTQFRQMRLNMGIHSQQFSWNLEVGDVFHTPEVIMTYTDKGLTSLTHKFHDVLRSNLYRGKFMNQLRPVLLNSWEAVYFDFDEKKLLEIAKASLDMGAELFVVDDGWFTNRNSDRSGLGDWEVDLQKLPHGLGWLSEQVHQMGLKFGIWIEPEMVSQKSQLYKDHPNWAYMIPGRSTVQGREQLVLDLSREDVRDYLVEKMNGIIETSQADYVKWDANRHLCDVFSDRIYENRQGEILHRYILGLYDIMDRIILAHPNVLFEGCSGGGGRFDAGMLYYQPQIWGSDDTDAIARLKIQYGLSFVYPSQCIGSHVSVCPNHQTGRTVPLRTRAITAMHGTFGFELDPALLSEEEKKMCQEYAKIYKANAAIMLEGDYYRLSNPYEQNAYTAWMHVSKDKTKAVVSMVRTESQGNALIYYVKLKGLKNDAMYELQDGRKFSGAALRKYGLPITWDIKEYEAMQYYLKEVEE